MLSIVIPTYNEEKYLPLLLQSINNQFFEEDYEIIVADNKSTDQTREIARQYGAIVTDGGMPGAGRNKGALAASGEYILFLDADVVLTEPHFLSDCFDEFREKNFGCATCRIVPLSDLKVDLVGHEAYNVIMVALAGLAPVAPGFCIWVKREVHDLISGFDEDIKLGEDTDYAFRAKKIAKFGVLMSHKVPTSIRRLERDGRFNIAMKYILAGLYMVFFGKIKTDIFKYTFGYK
jgi:Glycosyltransferases involved in cell wall biogenesis